MHFMKGIRSGGICTEDEVRHVIDKSSKVPFEGKRDSPDRPRLGEHISKVNVGNGRDNVDKLLDALAICEYMFTWV